MKRTRNIIVRLTSEEHKNLKKQCYEKNVSMSEFMRRAMILYIQSYIND